MINSDTLFSTIYWLPQSNAPVYELWEVIPVSWKITIIIFLLSLELKDLFAWRFFKPSLNSLYSSQRTPMKSATSEDMLLNNQEECSQIRPLLDRARNQMLLQNIYLNWQILKKALHSSNTFILFFFFQLRKDVEAYSLHSFIYYWRWDISSHKQITKRVINTVFRHHSVLCM